MTMKSAEVIKAQRAAVTLLSFEMVNMVWSFRVSGCPLGWPSGDASYSAQPVPNRKNV